MANLHDAPYVLSSFLTGFPELIARRGGRLNDICSRAGLAPGELSGPHRLLNFNRFVRLLEVSAEALRCRDFALQLAAGQDLRPMGPVASTFTRGQPVGAALETIARQLSLLVSGIRINLEQRTDVVFVRFEVTLPELAHRKQFQDYLLASTVNTVRQLSAGRYPLRGVYFTRASSTGEDLSTYHDYFHSPIAFGAEELRLTYDSRILECSISATAPEVPTPPRSGAATLQQRVTDVLAMAMPSGEIRLPVIAASMGCSPRTLRRHLAAQGLSFATLRDELRYAMANEYLQSTCYSIADIACLLGYANQSAFTRGYLRWSKITPSEFRASLEFGG